MVRNQALCSLSKAQNYVSDCNGNLVGDILMIQTFSIDMKIIEGQVALDFSIVEKTTYVMKTKNFSFLTEQALICGLVFIVRRLLLLVESLQFVYYLGSGRTLVLLCISTNKCDELVQK